MAVKYNPIKVTLKPKVPGMPVVGKTEPGAPQGGTVKLPTPKAPAPPAPKPNTPIASPVGPKPYDGAPLTPTPQPSGPQPYSSGTPLTPTPAPSGPQPYEGGQPLTPKYNPPDTAIGVGLTPRGAGGATPSQLAYGGVLGKNNAVASGSPTNAQVYPYPQNSVVAQSQGASGGAGINPTPGNGTFDAAGYQPVGQTVKQARVGYNPQPKTIKPHIVQPPNGPQPYDQGNPIAPKTGSPKNGAPVTTTTTGTQYNPPSGLKVVPAPYKFTPPPDLAGIYAALPANYQADMRTWDPNAAAAYLRAYAAGDYQSAQEWRDAAYRSRDNLNYQRSQIQAYNAELMKNYNKIIKQKNKGNGNGNNQPAPVGPQPYEDPNNPLQPTPVDPGTGGSNQPVQLDDDPSTWTQSMLAELAPPIGFDTFFQDVRTNKEVTKDNAIDLSASNATNAKVKSAKKKKKAKQSGSNNKNSGGWLLNPPSTPKKKSKPSDGVDPDAQPPQPGRPERPYRNRRTTRDPLAFGGKLRV